VPEEFDIGPLTWVKDEVNQALNSVLENLDAVTQNPDDLSPLRFSQTHLYQVSGALDMVGLEGCKRFCAEIEKLAGKVEKKEVPASSDVVQALQNAVNALSTYLQDLLGGAPDTPLKLFPALSILAAAQGETVEECELFFPDTSRRAPKDLPSADLDESVLPTYIAEQRSRFQKSLLIWLKDGSSQGLEEMRAAMENVQQAQKQPAHKTLWWVASAFTDALGQEIVAAQAGVKKLCRRLDQQLKSLSEGASRASGNLLRDILYYVALSPAATDRIALVKNTFELQHLLPATSPSAVTAEITETERAAVGQLKAVIDVLKDTWAEVSEGKEGALDNFMHQLVDVIEPVHGLSNQAVVNLFNSIHELATALDLDGTKINETALIEAATALNLLEDALKDYERVDAERMQRLGAQSQRLQDVMGGGPMADFAGTAMSDHLDNDVLLAVAQQIKDSLKNVEQALDTFFRNPADKEVLQSAEKPMQQIVAAFDMLDMLVPTQVAKASATFASYFSQAQASDQSLFELVAESLSLLGFYVEELPKPRHESFIALEGSLARLQTELEKLDLVSQQDAEEPLADAEVEDAVQVQEPIEATPAVEEQNEAIEVATPVIDEALQMQPQESAAAAPPDNAGPRVVDKAFDEELLDIYLTEAEEVLAQVAQSLQTLRVNATDNEALIEVRRGFHTLKGSGRTVGLEALGEVAWSVEKLMNHMMEGKVVPSAAQLNFIEQTSAAFAGWAGALRESGSVELETQSWKQRAAALESESDHQPPVAIAEEVVIDGTRKMSRNLFNIFLKEAEQHMSTLQQGLAALSVDSPTRPTEASRRAAHTLSSNAGTAGFKPIADLAKALEQWLDIHPGSWTSEALSLLDSTLTTLADMLRKAGQMRQPKPATGLLNVLRETTAKLEAEAEVQGLNASGLMDIDLGGIDEDLSSIIQDERLSKVVTEPEFAAAPQETIESIAMEPEPEAEKDEPDPAAELAQSVIQQAATAVDQELLTMFVEEARELVPQVGNELRAWRANPQQGEHPDALQRALHTLKGSARMAGQAELGDTVHSMEDRVIKALKGKASAIDFDSMFIDLDKIGGLLEAVMGEGTGITRSRATDAGEPEVAAIQARSSDRRAQYLRLRADVLDRLINEAGEISIARSRIEREMLGFKQFSMDLTESVFRLRNHLRELEIEAESQLQSRMTHLQESNETFDPLEFDRFTRLQELTRMLAESVNDVATIQHSLLMNLDETEAALQQQNRMNRDLQHGLMDVRMVPFSQISERLQRIVRQTARELNKRVEMVIEGENVEIDRSVLDKIGAPLEHLLRNSVAHGMESAQERKKLGKPEAGSIKLRVRQESDEIIMTVSDDGAGIKLDRVREKAIERGLLKADQEVSEQALLSVIFEAGFSTADAISQIAGRGVGLDAVRSDITALGGRIDVSNTPGKGAMFSVYLPVTLSVAQVVMIRAGHRVFAIPSTMVEQVQKLKPAPLAEAYEAHGVKWADRDYPLYFLGKLIGEEEMPEEQRYTPVILLRSGTYRIALHVDEIINNQEVVMKPIGPQLARVPGMMGATVMGDGKIILIINPVQLANREILGVGSIKVTSAAPVLEAEQAALVMVVDDSLTMRKVLSRALEREGYRVITAKDGMDAIQVLQENMPDIMLTDIEMPRMDGFELVRNVRDDEKTRDLPIIIISSRTAEKHRNLAKEIGVNAFLGKPVQDEELITQISILLGHMSPLTPA
jgi:chemosensory pili system protein ChpA (sensor histidine kinase/response regulator)